MSVEKFFLFLIALFSALLQFTKAENTTIFENTTICFYPLMNRQRIAQLQIDVINLIENANRIGNYTDYYDAEVQEEITYVLTRLRGFAVNETQANAWEEVTRQFFRAHILYIAVQQVQAYAQAHTFLSSVGANEPHGLVAQCVRSIVSRLQAFLNENYGYSNVADAIPRYELLRFQSLPLMATILPNEPHLRFRHVGAMRRRFVHESVLTYPSFSASPFRPIQNLINDVYELSRVTLVLNTYGTRRNNNYYSIYLDDYIEAVLLNASRVYLQELLLSVVEQRSNVVELMRKSVITYAFFKILMQMLAFDYKWLRCHPAYVEFNAQVSGISTIMRETGDRLRQLTIARQSGEIELSNELAAANCTHARSAFRSFLERRGITISYTPASRNGILIVDAFKSSI